MSLQAYNRAWALRSSVNLTPTERLVLLALCDFVRPNSDECWPKVSTLAEMVGTDTRRARRCLRRLEALGLVRTDVGGDQKGRKQSRRSSTYVVLAGFSEQPAKVAEDRSDTPKSEPDGGSIEPGDGGSKEPPVGGSIRPGDGGSICPPNRKRNRKENRNHTRTRADARESEQPRPSRRDEGQVIEGEILSAHEPASGLTFEDFWAVYPRRVDRARAERKWAVVIKSGADPAVIIAAAERYRHEREREAMTRGLDEARKYTKHPTTWLNAGSWENDPCDLNIQGDQGISGSLSAISAAWL